MEQFDKGFRSASDLVSKEAAITRQTVKDEAEKTRGHINAQQSSTTDMIREAKREEYNEVRRQAFLDSLRFHSMEERRNQISPSFEETCRWILRKEPAEAPWDCFTDWLESKQNPCPPYWISGKPGSGKTTLVKYLLKEPETKAHLDIWAQNPCIVSHFIWKLGMTPSQKNVKGVLCSVIYQLLQRDPGALESAYDRQESPHPAHESDWSVESLENLLESIIQDYPRSICLFLDGVDEIHPPEQIGDLLNMTNALTRKHPTKLKLCIASRPEPLIKRQLRQTLRLRLQDLNEKDIAHFVREKLILPSTDIKNDQKIRLVNLITGKAQGVFLWAHLVVANLIRGFEHEDDYEILEGRIAQLPGNLKDLYQDMWTRMNTSDGVYRDDAIFYLHLMLANHAMVSLQGSGFTPLIMGLGTDEALCPQMNRDEVLSPGFCDRLLECHSKFASVIETRTAGLLEHVELPYVSRGGLERHYEVPRDFDSGYGALEGCIERHRIRFIHRTALDFLRDTDEGQSVLARGSINSHMAKVRLIRAQLACSRVITGPGWHHMGTYFDAFHRFEVSGTFDDPNSTAQALQCIDLCLRLGGSGKIQVCEYDDEGPCHYICSRDTLCSLAVANGLVSWVPGALQSETFSNELKSRLLLDIPYELLLSEARTAQKALDLVEQLLLLGADPNHEFVFGHEERVFIRIDSWQPRAFPTTPWVELLGVLLCTSPDEEMDVHFINVLRSYVDRGADLHSMRSLVLEVTPDTVQWHRFFSKRGKSDTKGCNLIIRLTAAGIVRALYSRFSSKTHPPPGDDGLDYLDKWQMQLGVDPELVDSLIFIDARSDELKGHIVQGDCKESLALLICQSLERKGNPSVITDRLWASCSALYDPDPASVRATASEEELSGEVGQPNAESCMEPERVEEECKWENLGQIIDRLDLMGPKSEADPGELVWYRSSTMTWEGPFK